MTSDRDREVCLALARVPADLVSHAIEAELTTDTEGMSTMEARDAVVSAMRQAVERAEMVAARP